jgi:hypothetical protein
VLKKGERWAGILAILEELGGEMLKVGFNVLRGVVVVVALKKKKMQRGSVV